MADNFQITSTDHEKLKFNYYAQEAYKLGASLEEALLFDTYKKLNALKKLGIKEIDFALKGPDYLQIDAYKLGASLEQALLFDTYEKLSALEKLGIKEIDFALKGPDHRQIDAYKFGASLEQALLFDTYEKLSALKKLGIEEIDFALKGPDHSQIKIYKLGASAEFALKINSDSESLFYKLFYGSFEPSDFEFAYNNNELLITLVIDYSLGKVISEKFVPSCLNDAKILSINVDIFQAIPFFATVHSSLIKLLPYELVDIIIKDVLTETDIKQFENDIINYAYMQIAIPLSIAISELSSDEHYTYIDIVKDNYDKLVAYFETNDNTELNNNIELE